MLFSPAATTLDWRCLVVLTSALVTSADVPNASAEPQRFSVQTASTLSDPTTEFCYKHQLFPYLDLACELAQKTFRLARIISIEKKEDHEFPDEWVSIAVSAEGPVDEILDAYDRYTWAWLNAVPADSQRKVRMALGVA